MKKFRLTDVVDSNGNTTSKAYLLEGTVLSISKKANGFNEVSGKKFYTAYVEVTNPKTGEPIKVNAQLYKKSIRLNGGQKPTIGENYLVIAKHGEITLGKKQIHFRLSHMKYAENFEEDEMEEADSDIEESEISKTYLVENSISLMFNNLSTNQKMSVINLLFAISVCDGEKGDFGKEVQFLNSIIASLELRSGNCMNYLQSNGHSRIIDDLKPLTLSQKDFLVTMAWTAITCDSEANDIEVEYTENLFEEIGIPKIEFAKIVVKSQELFKQIRGIN